MTTEEYIKAAVRTESHPGKFLSNLNCLTEAWDYQTESLKFSRLLHSSIGLSTEVGELQECLDEGKGFTNFKEEIGDIMWYLAIAYDTLDIVPPNRASYLGINSIVIAVGNIQDVLKRSLFYDKELDTDRLITNLHDIYDYCYSVTDCDPGGLEDVMEKNIAKLKVRYPDKFTEHHAINRDLTKENAALVG